MKRPILVLCIDRDNDLFEKAKVSGPLVGRERNLQGAMALALADPEDPDSNAIFYAVKLYDQMRRDSENAEVVTLTGDRALGMKADRSVSSQLDKIVTELNPTSCVLVSDGASDEEILPIIKSRLKVDSTKIVFIKQAKELEKTYFVLLEKLRDPYFARIIIGIPAILILLFSLSSYFGFGWQPVGLIVGVYLLLRIFGVDEFAIGIIKDFRFSFERTSWIGYVGAVAIFAIALFIGYQTAQKGMLLNLPPEKFIALVLGSMVWIALMGLLMIMAGKAIDAVMERKKYAATKYLLYSSAAIVTTVVILVCSMWIANMNEPYVDFGMFLLTVAACVVLGYLATWVVNWYRKEILIDMKIEGKEAISERGTYLGRIVGVDARKGRLIIQTIFDKKYSMPVTAVVSVEDNVVMKSTD
jgi:putative membrane protein